MKIENYVVFCLLVFFTITNKQVGSLRITNLNPNNNYLEKNNINFSSKNEAANPNNNSNHNTNLNSVFISEKTQPPTFSRSFIDLQPKAANAGENPQQHYTELLKQIEQKKMLLTNLASTTSNQNLKNSIEKNPQMNSNLIENLITNKIDSSIANTNLNNPNTFQLQNQNSNKNNYLRNQNQFGNFPKTQNFADGNFLWKNALGKRFNSTTTFNVNELKNLLFETQKNIVSENSKLIENMKVSILSELKPILKTIADMQFFTYKKIKNLENSFGKIKEFQQRNYINNKTIEDITELKIPGLEDEMTEVGKLAKLSIMPEVDDLSNFGIEDNKSVSKGINNKTKEKEDLVAVNNKVKYNRNIRKPSKTIKDFKNENTQNEEHKKVFKNDKYNDP